MSSDKSSEQDKNQSEEHQLLPITQATDDKKDVIANSTESEIDADIDEFIPTPPDGGWGWVIVISSFMNHFILDGICYAFGSFMTDYSEYFESSAAATSALMSTLIGCYMLSAPFASALINKFGCRPVGFAGSCLASLAFVACTVSQSIETMIVLFGVCGGIGFGFMYMPAVVSVSMYFEKKRPLAVGIGMCGTGVGTFVFGPTSKYLLEHMDWKGAHFVLASIILQGTIFSALIRPLETVHDRKVKMEKRIAKRELKSNGKPESKITQPNTGLISERTGKPVNNAVMRSHPNMRSAHGSRLNVGSINVYQSMSKLGSHRMLAKISSDEAQDLKRPLYRKDIFYSGSVYKLPQFKETSGVQEYMASITSIPALHTDITEPKTFKCKCLPRQMADTLSEMLDFSLFKDSAFLLVAALSMSTMLAYFIPFAFTSVRAETLGIEKGKASFLISILGASTMVGRLVSSLIALLPNIRSLILHNFFLLMAGVACALTPFCTDFVTMAISAFCYGMFMGGHVALGPIILVELIGLDKLTTAYGIITLVRGISSIMGPPISGKLYDHFESYDISFYLAGGLIILSALGFFMLELKCFKKKSADDHTA